MPVREKRITSGPFEEMEIYFISQKEKSKGRAQKKKESRKEQKNLNNKNSTKHITRLIHANFMDGYRVEFTYDNKNLPKNEKEAKKDMESYIKRSNYDRKKKGLPNIKYIAVIEYKDQKEGKLIRIHHHIIMDSVVDRDTVEKIWKKGRANADRLQPDESGLVAIAKYITKIPKDAKGKKRWVQSKGLKQPDIKINDCKYTRKKMWELSRCQGEKDFIQRLYPKYALIEFKVEENDFIGTKINIKMRKLE